MKVELSNLAQVKNAVIEDADLTILVGDNGTGKTLILETIALLRKRFIREIGRSINDYVKANDDQIQVELNWEILTEKILDFVHNKDLDLREGETREIISNAEINFKFQNIEKTNEYFRKTINKITSKTKTEINEKVLLVENSNFNFTFKDLPKIEKEYSFKFSIKCTKQAEISFINLSNNQVDHGGYVFYKGNIQDIIENKIEGDFKGEVEFEGFNVEKIIELFKNKFKSMALETVYENYISSENLLYLPSERNILMENALTKASLEGLEKEKSESSFFKQRYSERLFNSEYLRYINLSRQYPDIIKLTGEKIEPLIDGKLIVSEDGEIESIKRKDGTIINRSLFSTKQNRLIPFLLIHSPLGSYNYIIIEEPEAHMSLKSMLTLLEYIQELINSGKKICISTHSDVFYSHINNMILKNQEQFSVGVYELKSDGRESNLDKKVEGDYGFEIDLFTEELEILYNKTLDIQTKK